ncbi:MAG: ACP S-malonyltransferase [Chloroflexota bacterium]
MLFPGQGSQFVGMAKDLWERAPEARRLIGRADEVLGQPLSRLMFEGPEEMLTRTVNAQPAIFVHSLALLSCLPPTPDVAFAAGHSVGEYSALVAAGAIEFDAALRLLQERGRLMERAGTERPGGMLAVIGLDAGAIEEACASVAPLVVAPANFNGPGQTVVSGELEGLQAVAVALKERGARRMLPLNVSAAFHSPLMAGAAAALGQAVSSVPVCAPLWPVIGNVTARPLTTASEIRQELADQVAAPVRWEESMRFLAAAGVRNCLEVGPGNVLAGLMKRIDPHVSVAAVSDLQ